MTTKTQILLIPILVFTSISTIAQPTETVEMADVLRRDGKIYTVVAGLVIILTAMIVLLIRVDLKIFRLERAIHRSRKEYNHQQGGSKTFLPPGSF